MYLKEIPCINKVTIPYHTKQVGGREGGRGPADPSLASTTPTFQKRFIRESELAMNADDRLLIK